MGEVLAHPRPHPLLVVRARIWATGTLLNHLLRGYTLNEQRLRKRGLHEIEQTVDLLACTLTTYDLVTGEGHAGLAASPSLTRPGPPVTRSVIAKA